MQPERHSFPAIGLVSKRVSEVEAIVHFDVPTTDENSKWPLNYAR
jgi:hypothetical protein